MKRTYGLWRGDEPPIDQGACVVRGLAAPSGVVSRDRAEVPIRDLVEGAGLDERDGVAGFGKPRRDGDAGVAAADHHVVEARVARCSK